MVDSSRVRNTESFRIAKPPTKNSVHRPSRLHASAGRLNLVCQVWSGARPKRRSRWLNTAMAFSNSARLKLGQKVGVT